MDNIYKIAVDTEGSDKGTDMVLGGCALALSEHPELELLLVGPRDKIDQGIERHSLPRERVEVLDCSEVITNFDNPTTAIFQKTDSSLVKGLSAAADREDISAFLNAGSTGALLVGALRFLPSENRCRPALAAVLPAERGGFVAIVDTGATIDCPASTLVHFARLGNDFMKKAYGIASPRIGLLSNGAEKTKGNKVVKEAHELLLAVKELNFVGNIEGTNALSGDCDVLVCDGFAGNQVLKVTEGTARRIITDIVKYAKKTSNDAIMPLVSHLMERYDFNSLGGGIILGTKKPIIKAHGAANELSIKSTLGMLLNIVKGNELYKGE